MERRRSVKSLIFIFFSITYLNLTSSRQVGSDSDEISNSNHICVSDQYITQSYFTTHTSLNDSEFQNFLLLQQCSHDANIVPAVSVLLQLRNITGEGSHRNLVTSIKLPLRSESKLDELVIVERLPLGVFADPFELQSLQKHRGFSDVAVFGDTNLELPSFRSNRSVVEIHVDIGSRDYENGEISVKLPLHARYQPLEESGYARVEFGEPDLFLCSSYVPNQGQVQRRCLVLSIGGSKTESSSVVWEIPAGIRDHTEYVSAFTFAAAVLSAFSILVASVLSSKPSKKIADAKLAKDFQAVLKEFQKAQQTAAERETAYMPFVPPSASPPSNRANETDKKPEQRAQVMESKRQELVLLDNEISFNEAVIEEREQGILEIHNQIGEVNEIFKDLAVLVNDQGVMIDDIGTHIDNSRSATAQGKSQLAQAAKTQRSNSSLTCLLLVIFGIVLLIVIIVLAA